MNTPLRHLIKMVDFVNRKGESAGGDAIHPKHLVDHPRQDWYLPHLRAGDAELRAGGFEVEGELEPVVHDTLWAAAIDALGGVSLAAYDRLSRWRRSSALRRPGDSTGFRARIVKAPR